MALAQPDTTRVILTLSGENFTPQSSVFVGTTQYTPEYVSPTTLRISVLRSTILAGQTNKNVRVVNPSAGGGTSRDVPIVLACRAANGVFAEVNITMETHSFHVLDSARFATPKYAQTTISDDMRRQLQIMNIPSVKKSSISGDVFNDGNAVLRFDELSSNAPYDLPVSDQIKYNIVKTATDSVEYYSGTNKLLFKLPIGSKPFKLVVDKIREIQSVLPSPSQTQAQGIPQASVGGPGQGFAAAPQPMPTDSNIIKSPLLIGASSKGLPVERIASSPFYRITLKDSNSIIIPNDILSSIQLAKGEEIHLLVHTPSEVVQEIRTFRTTPQDGKILSHRVIQNYSFDSNNRIKWKSKVSYSYYEYEGIPMVFGNADIFEQFSVRLIE